MSGKRFRAACFLLAALALCALAPGWAAEKGKSKKREVFADFDTSLGRFTVKLFPDKAPETVRNFTELAEGKKAWPDPRIRKWVKKPFYDGCKIFKVVPGVLFQAGSPTDRDTYAPAITIPDEIDPSLNFSKPGMLAMARGDMPNSASTQIFITTSTRWRAGEGRYTIFGQVVSGMDVVKKIDSVKVTRDPASFDVVPNRPVDMPVIKKVTIRTVKETKGK